MVVEYKTEDGMWRRAGAVPGNPGRMRWRVPDIAPEILADAYLRVILQDGKGRTLGEDGNEYPFFILGARFLSLPSK